MNEKDVFIIQPYLKVNKIYKETDLYEAKKLIEATYESMMKAIKILKEGIYLGDIGYTIQIMLRPRDFQLCKIFVDTELVKNFIKNQIFYIMEKKVMEKK